MSGLPRLLRNRLPIHLREIIDVLPVRLRAQQTSVCYTRGAANCAPALARQPYRRMRFLNRGYSQAATPHRPVLTLMGHLFPGPKSLHQRD